MATSAKKRCKTKSSARRRRSVGIAEIPRQSEQEFHGPLDVARIQQEITNRVIGRALELVNDTIQHIKDGNFQAMKYLFEAVGLLPMRMEESQPARNELGKQLSDLLEGTMRPEGENAALKTAVSSPDVK